MVYTFFYNIFSWNFFIANRRKDKQKVEVKPNISKHHHNTFSYLPKPKFPLPFSSPNFPTHSKKVWQKWEIVKKREITYKEISLSAHSSRIATGERIVIIVMVVVINLDNAHFGLDTGEEETGTSIGIFLRGGGDGELLFLLQLSLLLLQFLCLCLQLWYFGTGI